MLSVYSSMLPWCFAEGIITACHLTFAGPKRQMSEVWSDILTNEIIRTRLNVWQFLDWSDILSVHFRKVIIPSGLGPAHAFAIRSTSYSYKVGNFYSCLYFCTGN